MLRDLKANQGMQQVRSRAQDERAPVGVVVIQSQFVEVVQTQARRACVIAGVRLTVQHSYCRRYFAGP